MTEEPQGTFTMAHAFNPILTRYSHTMSEEDYNAAEAYSDVLGASLGHYLAINSPARDVVFGLDWKPTDPPGQNTDMKIGVLSFDLIGPRNNHVGRVNVAKHIIDYLELARAHAKAVDA